MIGSPVRVTVPADETYARVVRVVVSDAAATLGVPFDRFADLGLAVQESFAELLRGGVSAIECSVAADDEALRVELSASSTTGLDWPPSEAESLAALVLETVTDRLVWAGDADRPAIIFYMNP